MYLYHFRQSPLFLSCYSSVGKNVVLTEEIKKENNESKVSEKANKCNVNKTEIKVVKNVKGSFKEMKCKEVKRLGAYQVKRSSKDDMSVMEKATLKSSNCSQQMQLINDKLDFLVSNSGKITNETITLAGKGLS